MRRAGLLPAMAMALAWAPAAAQEPTFSPDATEACLAGGSAPADCVGSSAEACIDTPDGSTTVGMGICLRNEFDYWEQRLTGAYETLLAFDQATDSEMRELGSAAPPTAAALTEMQRAWSGFRDAACAYEMSLWGGGSGGGPAATDCMMRLTAQQALALEERVKRASGP